jgi:hypothetical protein
MALAGVHEALELKNLLARESPMEEEIQKVEQVAKKGVDCRHELGGRHHCFDWFVRQS